jgi:hypothetical protein
MFLPDFAHQAAQNQIAELLSEKNYSDTPISFTEISTSREFPLAL